MKRLFNLKVAKIVGMGTIVLCFYSFSLHKRHDQAFSPTWGENGLTRFLNNAEWQWYDFKLQARPVTHPKNVIVAKIDDDSLNKFGRWPWSRAIYRQVLDSLFMLGAEVVSFDAVFSEKEFNERGLLRDFGVVEGADQQAQVSEGSLADQIKMPLEAAKVLAKNLPNVGTQQFAMAVAQHPKTVLGYFWQRAKECQIYDPDRLNGAPPALSQEEAERRGYLFYSTFDDKILEIKRHAIFTPEIPGVANSEFKYNIPNYPCPVTNLSELNAQSRFMGYFNSFPDPDGIFRRIPLLFAFDPSLVSEEGWDWFDESEVRENFKNRGTFFSSLSLSTVLAYWNDVSEDLGSLPKPKLNFSSLTGKEVALDSIEIPRKNMDPLKIPVMPDGALAINFFGSQKIVGPEPEAIAEISLSDIPIFGRDYKNLEDLKKFNFELLGDKEFQDRVGIENEGFVNGSFRPLDKKIVIIGPTALGVYDLRPNPVQGDAAGVFLHATTVARILEYADNPRQAKLALSFPAEFTGQSILWVLGILMAFILAFSTALQGAFVAVLIVVVFGTIDLFYLFPELLWALDSVTIVLGLASVAASILAFKYFTEERDRAFVKGAFEKYVSPDVVGSILKDPKKLNLGGQKKELSVLFSDIRSFTTISEKMEASELAQFMNEYLSPMTDIVLKNRGTIDKYMGDAIMAIFGAPVEYEDHADAAVKTGLEMLEKLAELRGEWEARGLPNIEIGVGVNTGDMSVGNMGSTQIFSYTVMGDAVNLGSRLEGINKEYATHFIISEDTLLKLRGDFVCRELDRVRVKGKTEPVKIFEVVGESHKVGPEKQAIVKRFSEGLELYYQAKFIESEKIFQELESNDPTSKLYVARSQEWQKNPPEPDWDGSWVMETK